MNINPAHIALITDYVARAVGLDEDSPPSDFAAVNALALRCMVELPNDLWHRVITAVQSPTSQGPLGLMMWLRAAIQPNDPINPDMLVWHGRGLRRDT